MLLGLEDSYKSVVDSDTFEGANVLITKIGYLIDDKLNKLKSR